MNGVTLLLDEVFPVFHELLQRHHGVIVDVELVVGGPGFHGDQHDSGIELFPENLRKMYTFLNVSFWKLFVLFF